MRQGAQRPGPPPTRPADSQRSDRNAACSLLTTRRRPQDVVPLQRFLTLSPKKPPFSLVKRRRTRNIWALPGGQINGCGCVVMGNNAHISVRPVTPSDLPDKGRPWDGAFYRDQTETDAKGPETAFARLAFTKPNDVHGHLACGTGRPLWRSRWLTSPSALSLACHDRPSTPPDRMTTGSAHIGQISGSEGCDHA